MVKVLISADSKFPIDKIKITKAAEATLREKGITSDVEISILICGERKSRELAKKYLQDDKAHSILSFPTETFPAIGDIAVCYPIAQTEANLDNVLVDTKISELVSHGTLHLLGVHHAI